MASPTSDRPMPPISIMADKEPTSVPSSSLSSPSHQNGWSEGIAPKQSPTPHQNGGLILEQGPHNPHISSPGNPTHSAPSSRTSAPLRNLRSLVSPEGSSSTPRPQDQSLSSAMTFRRRISGSRSRCKSNQQEEPDALIDLILESQGQRLNDQRASLSLLPDTGPPALCGTCSPNQPPLPSLEFYYMLIKYQSDRMEDQRSPLPDMDDMVGSVSDGQETFFSLIQRVQSRRMDEQRASLLMVKDDDKVHAALSWPPNPH